MNDAGRALLAVFVCGLMGGAFAGAAFIEAGVPTVTSEATTTLLAYTTWTWQNTSTVTRTLTATVTQDNQTTTAYVLLSPNETVGTVSDFSIHPPFGVAFSNVTLTRASHTTEVLSFNLTDFVGNLTVKSPLISEYHETGKLVPESMYVNGVSVGFGYSDGSLSTNLYAGGFVKITFSLSLG